MARFIVGPEAVKELDHNGLRKMHQWQTPVLHAIDSAVREELKERPEWFELSKAGIKVGDVFIGHAVEELRDANIPMDDPFRVSTYILWLIAKQYLYICIRVFSDGSVLGLRIRTAGGDGRPAGTYGFSARVVKPGYAVQHSDFWGDLQVIMMEGNFELLDNCFTYVNEPHRFGSERLVCPVSLRLAGGDRVKLAVELKRLHPEMTFPELNNNQYDDTRDGMLARLQFARLPLQLPPSVLDKKVWKAITVPDTPEAVRQDASTKWPWPMVEGGQQLVSADDSEPPAITKAGSMTGRIAASHDNRSTLHTTQSSVPGSGAINPPDDRVAVHPDRAHLISSSEPRTDRLERSGSVTDRQAARPPSGVTDALRQGMSLSSRGGDNLGLHEVINAKVEKPNHHGYGGRGWGRGRGRGSSNHHYRGKKY
ncbi:hypothetical protein LTR17_004586 [Elasticomyces elasticus]|nr:hypothetical protein LTR17_004586 [Elasticomyces elasticus]